MPAVRNAARWSGGIPLTTPRRRLTAGEVRARYPPLGVVPEHGRTFEFACCRHCAPSCDDWHRQPCDVTSCIDGAQRIEKDDPNAYAARYARAREVIQ